MKNLKIYSNLDLKNNKVEIKTVKNIEDFANTIIVFRGHPYFEMLKEEYIKAEYELYQDKGIAFGAYIIKKNFDKNYRSNYFINNI